MLRWLFSTCRRRRVIVVAPMWDDIWAGSEGNKDMWCTGKSPAEALGNLVLNHQQAFGVDVRMIFGGQPKRPLGGMYIHVHENQYDAMVRAAGWSAQ